MEDDGIFYGHLVHFTVFCYILWTFRIFVINWYFLVFCTKKNLATLPVLGGNRVTRTGLLLPIGRLFTLGSLLNNRSAQFFRQL
jgi:hypothetical protein